jgi:hypothetical protein
VTYESDIDSRFHDVGYFVEFDGIETRIADRDMSVLADGETYLQVVSQNGISISGSRLSERRTLIRPGGMTIDLMGNEDVRGLLRHRGGTEDVLGVSMSASTTTLVCGSGGATYDDGATVYVDQETVVLGSHIGSGYYTSCTRGAHGSQARAHGRGSIVSSVPRYWYGRRAVLTAVNMQTGTSEPQRGGVLIGSPDWDGLGEFSLSFGDMQTQLNRSICSGWLSERVVSAAVVDDDTSGARAVTFEVGDARQFSTVADGYVEVRYPGGFIVFKLDKDNVDTGADTVEVDLFDLVTGEDERSGLLNHISAADTEGLDIELRQVEWLEDMPANIALYLMLSDLGDAANGSYDVLPGVSPALTAGAEDIVARRMGAAIPEAWVDVASFQAVRDSGQPMRLYLNEQTTLLDLLVNEIAPRLGGAITSTRDGKIGFKRFGAATPTPESNIESLVEADCVGEVMASDDETQAVPAAIVECNYDHLDRTFGRRIEVLYKDVTARWENARRRYVWSSKTLQVGEAGANRLASPQMAQTDIEALLDRIYSRVRDGARRITTAVAWHKHLSLTPGTRFRFTHSKVPDFEGGLGVTTRDMEVTGQEIDAETGRVQITAEELQAGVLIAPAFFVGSWDGGTNTITIDTTGAEGDLFDGSPGLDVAEDFTLRICAGPYGASSVTAVVASVTATTVVLTGTPSPAPATGDICILEYTADTGNTNASNADVGDHAFMADSAGLIDNGGGNERAAMEYA